MTKRREAKDLAPEECKRIVAGWREYMEWNISDLDNPDRGIERCHFYAVAATLIHVHEDTVRLVLSEEKE